MSTTPVRYRRRSRSEHTILAWQVTVDNLDAVARWCHGRVEYRLTVPGDVSVRPDRCTTAARIGDYIAQAAEGEWWYPVKRILFELHFEPAHRHPSGGGRAARPQD